MLVVEARHTTEAKHGGPPLPTRRSPQAQRASYNISSKTLRRGPYRGGALARSPNRAAHQIEILAALHEDRSSSCASAYCGAYRRAFTATGNRTNRRTNGRADAGAHHPAACLATLTLHGAFIINRDSFTTRCPDILNVSGEVGSAPIAQQDSVEIERHLGPARELTGAVHRAIWYSMRAPSYWPGDRTVKVKRSP
jgi:hypothetical protein